MIHRDFFTDLAFAKVRKGELNNHSRNQELLYQRSKQAHGGIIGTSGKAVISLRFDDWQDQLLSTIVALLQARALPWGHALLSRFTTKTYGRTATWSDILAWNKAGMEVWCHGTDHLDPEPYGYAGYYDQIVTAKAEIETHSLKVQGWMNPGVPEAERLTSKVPYEGLTDGTGTWASYNTDVGSLILDTYPLSEAYIWGYERYLPMSLHHGATYYGIESLTLAQLQGYVDRAITRNCGIEFMTHGGRIGQAGYLSLADFTTWLDYLVTQWDAGLIEILTPSGMYFADPGSTRRLDLVADSSFGDTVSKWTLASSATIETSGGSLGNNFLRHPNSTTASTIQYRDGLLKAGLNGETFMFDGKCRSNGSSTTTAKVILQDYNNHADNVTGLSIVKTFAGITTSWTKVRIPFSLLTTTDKLTMGLARSSGDGVDWDDVHVYKV